MMTGSTIVDFLFSLMWPRFCDVVGKQAKKGEREFPRFNFMQIYRQSFLDTMTSRRKHLKVSRNIIGKKNKESNFRRRQ